MHDRSLPHPEWECVFLGHLSGSMPQNPKTAILDCRHCKQHMPLVVAPPKLALRPAASEFRTEPSSSASTNINQTLAERLITSETSVWLFESATTTQQPETCACVSKEPNFRGGQAAD